MVDDILVVGLFLLLLLVHLRALMVERKQNNLHKQFPVMNGRHTAPEGKTRHSPRPTEVNRPLPDLSEQYLYISLGEVIIEGASRDL